MEDEKKEIGNSHHTFFIAADYSMICVFMFLTSIEANRKMTVERDGLSLSLLGFASFELSEFGFRGAGGVQTVYFFESPAQTCVSDIWFRTKVNNPRCTYVVQGCPTPAFLHFLSPTIHGYCEPLFITASAHQLSYLSVS